MTYFTLICAFAFLLQGLMHITILNTIMAYISWSILLEWFKQYRDGNIIDF